MAKGGGSGRGASSRSAQRSDAKNPNNPAHKAAADNRSNQMNPNNPAYRGGKGSG